MKITKEMISRKAYELWEGRGCPPGSAEQDWFTAEALLRQAPSAGDGSPEGAPGRVPARTRYGLREFEVGS